MTSSLNSERFQVAILGRANVGKSTLFNRLLGKRRAITHSSAGVTRDAVEERIMIQDREVTLLDTGGYTREQGPIEKRVAENLTRIARDSDLILLVVAAAGLTGEDLEFLEMLRRHAGKLVLVVNKVDGDTQAMNLGEFHELGLRRLIAVSAAHGRNIDELKQCIYQAVPESGHGASHDPAPGSEKSIRLTILGKPNTGKSTLLNRLLKFEKSLVSELPGTTRDPVEGSFSYREQAFQVVDTAGIRRKSKVSEAVEYYSVNRAIKSIEEADIVLLVIDVAEGISEQDKKIASLAARRGRGIILVHNKWDSLVRGRGQSRRLWQEVRDRTRFQFPSLGFAPAVRISALSGWGIGRLLQTVRVVYNQLNQQVNTGRLNQLLKEWIGEYALPVRGRNVKIRYATQTGVNPVRFLFFVNNRRGYPQRYTRYLIGRIRRDLGFDAVPLFVDVRES